MFKCERIEFHLIKHDEVKCAMNGGITAKTIGCDDKYFLY